ncbi:MAG: hypothetical protein LUJ25_03045 [Firmicutes bacterium]|nr:hypothetical protein [Bacillota bacterium]
MSADIRAARIDSSLSLLILLYILRDFNPCGLSFFDFSVNFAAVGCGIVKIRAFCHKMSQIVESDIIVREGKKFLLKFAVEKIEFAVDKSARV